MVDYLRTFARGDVLIEAAVFGYIRVSQAEGESGLATQRRTLNDHGLRDDRIFTDVISGRNMRRHSWNTLREMLRPGDVVVVPRIDRLARNPGHRGRQPDLPPHAPVSHDSVTLDWDDPGDSSITGYQVLRRSRDGDEYGDGRGTVEFVPIVDDTGSGETTYTDRSVTARTRYVYRVKAINLQGLSARSSYLNVEISATPVPTLEPNPEATPEPTAEPTPTVPSRPTGLTASSVSHDSVVLSWDDPGDGSITGYQILRRSRDRDEYGDGQGAPEFVAIVDDTGSASTTDTDSSLTARTKYVYRAKAMNASGLSAQSSYVNVETPPPLPGSTPAVPTQPTGLVVESSAHDSVTLVLDDPGDSSITGYRVLRRSRDRDEFAA